jgi:hypothetical protein
MASEDLSFFRLQEKRRFRVSKNRVLRTVCWSQKDEVICNGGKYIINRCMISNAQQYVSLIKSGITRGAGHVEVMGHRKGPHRTMVKRPEGKIPLRNPRRICGVGLRGHGLE